MSCTKDTEKTQTWKNMVGLRFPTPTQESFAGKDCWTNTRTGTLIEQFRLKPKMKSLPKRKTRDKH